MIRYKIELNSMPCWYVLINGNTYFELSTICFAIGINPSSSSRGNLLKRVSACNIYRESDRGRNSGSYINTNGVSEIMAFSFIMTHYDKKRIIEELQFKLNEKINIVAFSTTFESNFMGYLQEFFSGFGAYTLKSQIGIGHYIVDALIDDSIIVEYDENNHNSYDKQKEKERSDYLIGSGYSIIRVSDRDSVHFSIGKILKHLK